MSKLSHENLVDKTLVFLAQLKWKEQNNNFLDALVAYLCDTFDLKFAFVDYIEHSEKPKAQTISLYSDGKLLNNIEYDLNYTPCENVFNKSYCAYETKVQELFPKDQLLVDLNVDSYAGIPLFNLEGYPIGLIGVMDDKPLTMIEEVKAVLQMAALRSAHELEQLIIKREIQERNDRMELVISLQKELLSLNSISNFSTTVLNHISKLTNDSSISITCAHITNNHYHICKDRVKHINGSSFDLFTDKQEFIKKHIEDTTKTVVKDNLILIPYIDYNYNNSMFVVVSEKNIPQDEALDTYLASSLLAVNSLVVKRRKEIEQKKLFASVGELIEEKDKVLHNHITHVSEAVRLFSQKLGLDEEMVSNLEIASSIHDIGKIFVSDEILERKGKLSKEEFNLVKRHSTDKLINIDLNDSSLLSVVGKVVRYHHENFDGTGYPEGLKGEEIPYEARIVSIIDVFEALTNERPYKKTWSYKEALDYIVDNKGKKFDPKLVDTFVTCSKDVYKLFE